MNHVGKYFPPTSKFIPRLSIYPSTNYQTNSTMDKAKASVKSFLAKDGKHDTTVHEVRIQFILHSKVGAKSSIRL
jgi:hypothetical protein